MEIPKHWRLFKNSIPFVGNICPEGHKSFPPVRVCKSCKEKNEVIVFSSSRSPLCTSSNYMAELKMQPQRQEQ